MWNLSYDWFDNYVIIFLYRTA